MAPTDPGTLNGTSRFEIGQRVLFAGLESVVREVAMSPTGLVYLVHNGPDQLPMWVPAAILASHQSPDHPGREFVQRSPDVIVVDDFLVDPDQVRQLALAQKFGADLRFYKGVRTYQRFLWPHLREEFGRLLGLPVTEWLGYPANGVFQRTSYRDPLVWHHDQQRYAAAVYLNPDPPAGSGTSFWRDRTYGCRRPPTHPAERRRLGTAEAIEAAQSVVYDPYNIEHGDNWELVESVAGLYNRLVIWDAQLFHSATSYDGFEADGDELARLVQLFFFDAG